MSKKKIFFSHIPKNSGTSVDEYFISLLGVDNVFGCSITEQCRRDFYEHTQNIIERYTFISGHLPSNSLGPWADSFSSVFFVVREPMRRFVSMANYICESYDDYNDIRSLSEFGERFYFSNVSTRNEQCGYIGEVNTCGSALKQLKRPNFVALRHEYIAEDFRNFCLFRGFGLGILPHVNRTNYQTSRFQLTDLFNNHPLIDKVACWFSDDIALHSALCWTK
ncbi:sulfotransferase family 2 domain-containing protein [Azohydromonas lata]|uniref:Sulfotransferase family 2 domain-containing protein n=1 Tax=Azohydromonas lata TaxID=45677 RepID=A0ABU5IN72_9BURK|nr:sulfotransferase family 2 domain-containing protein [Azohydromonas lata]MDZ5460321.1 sulfotransferase family 2 domain-containing protein [Azohydromonas lata]